MFQGLRTQDPRVTLPLIPSIFPSVLPSFFLSFLLSFPNILSQHPQIHFSGYKAAWHLEAGPEKKEGLLQRSSLFSLLSQFPLFFPT